MSKAQKTLGLSAGVFWASLSFGMMAPSLAGASRVERAETTGFLNRRLNLTEAGVSQSPFAATPGDRTLARTHGQHSPAMQPSSADRTLKPRLGAILALVFLASLGFIRLVIKMRRLKSKYTLAAQFLSRLQQLANSLPEGFDEEAYIWLTQQSVGFQRQMGSLGRISYRPAFENHMFNDYQLIVNSLGGLRLGRTGRNDLILCEDAILRYAGVISDESLQLRHLLANPLAWLREGAECILAFPWYILESLGILSSAFVRVVVSSGLFRFLAGIVAFLGVVSSVVTITVGWTQFVAIVRSITGR